MQTEFTVLRGLRRELTRELFEELGAIQCSPEEILGYIGTTERKLTQWCRRNYRRPLGDMLGMIRQDGLVAIRRASFDQLKKSATIVSQQYNRFLPSAGRDVRADAEAAVRAFTTATAPEPEEIRRLYMGMDPEAAEGGEPD